MRVWLFALVLAACGGSEPPPAPRAAPEPAAPPLPEAPAADAEIPPVPEGSTGSPSLRLSAKRIRPGEHVTITFSRPGPDGCYRQSPVETVIGDNELTHTYTTSREGELCTQQLVPGGFRYDFTPPTPGAWSGRVIVDGQQIITYVVESGA